MEEIPQRFNLSHPQKGDKTLCQNCRGINLLSNILNICQHFPEKEIYTEEIPDEYLYGFRRGRSTVDQIFVMRQIMEKCFKHNTDPHIDLSI